MKNTDKYRIALRGEFYTIQRMVWFFWKKLTFTRVDPNGYDIVGFKNLAYAERILKLIRDDPYDIRAIIVTDENGLYTGKGRFVWERIKEKVGEVEEDANG